MSGERTLGQVLYERLHPKTITVWTKSSFGEPMVIPNPKFQVDWKFITAAEKLRYEEDAKYHNLTSSGRGAARYN